MRPRVRIRVSKSGRSGASGIQSPAGDDGARGPRVLVVLGSTVAFGAAFAVVIAPRTALYWYVFPLFGIAVPYLVEVRRELTLRWWLTFAVAGVVSPIALALDWPFSGHILWNVLLLGHVARTPARNTAWPALLGASLIYLFALKAATQTRRDLAGGVLSAVLAGGILVVTSTRSGCVTRRPGR
ncbi:MAG: hypothetical protein ABI894_14180 [Ilumatobacteraceae bacterium]